MKQGHGLGHGPCRGTPIDSNLGVGFMRMALVLIAAGLLPIGSAAGQDGPRHFVVTAGPAFRGTDGGVGGASGFTLDALSFQAAWRRGLGGSAALHLGLGATLGETSAWASIQDAQVPCLEGGDCFFPGPSFITGESYHLTAGITLMDPHLEVTIGPTLVLVPQAQGGDLATGAFANVALYPLRGFLGGLGASVQATRLFRATGGLRWMMTPGLSWRF